ncbi:MAG: prepilin-type N-terminal cleavage/methylation domain-containing protein [Planctomycetota bacterium]
MKKRCTGNGRAFTLIELLVVVAIIALLIGLLLPVLSRARVRAQMTGCLSNQRNLLIACALYASDEKDRMPHPNWGVQSMGWLFTDPLSEILDEADPLGPSTGTIWNYLDGSFRANEPGIAEVYSCPSHVRDESSIGTTETITSFIFNGALVRYSDFVNTSFRISQMRPDSVVLWEAQTRGEGGNDTWNDGGSSPTEGLSTRHGLGATAGAIDGSARWIIDEEWAMLLEKQPGPLWCVPGRGNNGR